MANVKKILTKTNFRDWLQYKRPNEAVGLANEPDACPLYNFLVDNQIKVKFITATWELKKLDNKYYKIPQWSKNFIRTVDKLGDKVKISATKALEILQTS